LNLFVITTILNSSGYLFPPEVSSWLFSTEFHMPPRSQSANLSEWRTFSMSVTPHVSNLVLWALRIYEISSFSKFH
jgi:hypothetical protein